MRGFAEPWPETRRNILWAGGLRDSDATRRFFEDGRLCDLVCVTDAAADTSPAKAAIRAASLPELGPGGSWATDGTGCAADPPADAAHASLRSRLAFKLVWTPGATDSYRRFVLVDDEGVLLASGAPTGNDLPPRAERTRNFGLVVGSKYERAATVFRWPDVFDPTYTKDERGNE